jgi:uncharacterized membrane protein YjgN (DUF898 family)
MVMAGVFVAAMRMMAMVVMLVMRVSVAVTVTVPVRLVMRITMPMVVARAARHAAAGRLRGVRSHFCSLVVARIYCQPKRFE